MRSNLDSSKSIKTISGDHIHYAITQLKNKNLQYEYIKYLLEYKNQLEQINENDIIYFGHYVLCNSTHPKEINIRMPIAWIILKKEESKLLLLSRYCLTWEFYNGPFFCIAPELDITWEKSTIREWTNKEWFDNYFTVEERKLILESDIVTRNNFKFGTEGGGHTKDKLFFLRLKKFQIILI